MIGKITVGKSFRGCLLYCLNDKVQKKQNNDPVFKNRAEIISFNQCSGNQQQLVSQFNQVRQLNPNLSKPVLHITLSLSPGESLSRDKLMEAVEQCARGFGFDKNQYVSVLHKDTGHQHIHIVANRIGFDKRTVSDSNSFQKIAGYCRKMELTYKLQQVQSPRRFLSNKQQLRPSQDKRKMKMQQDVKEVLVKAGSYADFERLMKEKNYQVLKTRGIAFIDDKKVYVKGSEIGFSFQTIERILDQKSGQRLNQPGMQPMQKQPVHQEAYKASDKPQTTINQATGSTGLSNVLNKKLEDLINPRELNEQVPQELLQKKKKKQQKKIRF